MGWYIDKGLATKNKADDIITLYDGRYIDKPASFAEIPDNKALIIVVENHLFDAAGYVYDEREFIYWTCSGDKRPMKFILMDKKLTEELTGYACAHA